MGDNVVYVSLLSAFIVPSPGWVLLGIGIKKIARNLIGYVLYKKVYAPCVIDREIL